MLGVELITTRRRRQLEAAESGLKLRGIRGTLRALIAEVMDTRTIHVECSTVPGGGYDSQADADETKRLDHLITSGKATLSYLGDDEPVTAEDLHGA